METSKTVETERTTGPRLAWNAVRSWAYWLDNPDLAQLSASNVDLFVIDYSADGTVAKIFRAEQINQLRKTDARRRVVAYLSIGQAESYRGYWKSGWHLDRIDAYQEAYASGHEDDMVQFVTEIARYARAHSPLGEDFGIIAQNAEELAANHPEYVQLVTGIGREEVYVRATDTPTSPAERARAEGYLDRFLQNSLGKLVLTVDYATKPELICEAYQRARARGYIPYVTRVELDRLQTEPACP